LRIDKNDSSRKIIGFGCQQSTFVALFDEMFVLFILKKHALAVFSFDSYFAKDE
jgi:hypothetical protein